MKIIVLGMHRSGTSMVTGLLEMCGVATGIEPDKMSKAEDNPLGFWEREDVREINDELLRISGAAWDEVSKLDTENENKDQLDEIYQNRIIPVVDEIGLNMNWVLKDPRFCLTFPFWKDIVGDCIFVVPFRNPVACAISLQHRNSFSLSFGMSLWEFYMLRAHAVIKDRPSVFVSYEKMLLEPTQELKKLIENLEHLGCEKLLFPTDEQLKSFIRPELNRSGASESIVADNLRSHESLKMWNAITGSKFIENYCGEEISSLSMDEISAHDHNMRKWKQLISDYHDSLEEKKQRLIDLSSEFEVKNLLVLEQQDKIDELGIWGKGLTADLKARDELILSQNAKLVEMTKWSNELHSNVREKDECILDQNERLEQLSKWGQTLDLELRSRDELIHDQQAKLSEFVSPNDKSVVELEAKNDLISEYSSRLHDLEKLNEEFGVKVKEKEEQISANELTIGELKSLNKEYVSELKEKDKLFLKLKEETENLRMQLSLLVEKQRLKDQMLVDKKVALESLENLTSKMQEKLKDNESKNLELEEQCASSHSQLMEMSDWASGMKARLNLIERSKLLKSIERLNRKVNYWSNLHNKIGIKGIISRYRSKIIRRFFPEFYEKKLRNSLFSDLRKSTSSNNGKVVVVFPVIDWNFRWQRPQQILERLSNRGYTVIYLSVNIRVVRDDINSELSAMEYLQLKKFNKNVYELRLCSTERLNVYTDDISDANLDSMFWGLFSVFKSLGPRIRFTYLFHLPTWYPLFDRIKDHFPGRMMFDCMDDHSGFDTATASLEMYENRIICESESLIVSSDCLLDSVKAKGRDATMIRNACEFHHFSNRTKIGDLDFCSGRKVVGYYGAISTWFDVELLMDCVMQFPDTIFLLIGKITGFDKSVFEGYSNLHLLGEIDYETLPSYYSWFDVCLIPFKIIPLIKATNPVKFYEYLSQGKPVVSTNLPELRYHEDLCYLAENREDFVNLLREALNENPSSSIIEERINLAKNNTWDVRCDRFVDVLNQANTIQPKL